MEDITIALKVAIEEENIDSIAVNIKLSYLDDIIDHIVIDLINKEQYNILIFILKVSNSYTLWGFACGYASNMGKPELMQRILNACKLPF
jgi:hypothetical protein